MFFKKLTKKMAIVLSLSLSVFSIPILASAEAHETDKLIIQWGHDGGISFSIWAKVSSRLGYDISFLGDGQTLYTYNYSEANISLNNTASYGLAKCGDTVGIRKQTNWGSTAVPLPTRGTYVVPVGTTIIGYETNATFGSMISGSVNVDNYGFVQPTPSMCVGGDSITDKFTVQH
ncbi:hypothetical protein [Paenibacillus sp. GCM10027626]|uniref:hypothetical protein n=1 Tax=Paenibacillus sp. GCM10027626 TaxID=3273411 RepID=UPI003629F7A4